MDVISMPNINLTPKRLRNDFPDIHFIEGDEFCWSSDKRTITHPPILTSEDVAQLLHEIAHAQLGHSSYARDISLIDMERQAWEYAAKTLAPAYGVNLEMEDAVVDTALDGYRQWLHNRSTCPLCQAIGVEISPRVYQCLSCQGGWRVNEARTCQLRRYTQ